MDNKLSIVTAQFDLGGLSSRGEKLESPGEWTTALSRNVTLSWVAVVVTRIRVGNRDSVASLRRPCWYTHIHTHTYTVTHQYI